MIEYTEELFKQLYKDGLISPTAERDFKIRKKAESMPGKLSNKVRILAKANNLSIRQVYHILSTSTI
jgi:hypothetical protein